VDSLFVLFSLLFARLRGFGDREWLCKVVVLEMIGKEMEQRGLVLDLKEILDLMVCQLTKMKKVLVDLKVVVQQ